MVGNDLKDDFEGSQIIACLPHFLNQPENAHPQTKGNCPEPVLAPNHRAWPTKLKPPQDVEVSSFTPPNELPGLGKFNRRDALVFGPGWGRNCKGWLPLWMCENPFAAPKKPWLKP